MRVTNNVIFDTFRRNLQQSTKLLLTSQEVMATQKKINRVSDDPVTAGIVQDTRTKLAVTDQFLRNIGRAESTAILVDKFMSQTTDLIARAKELMLSQANSATATEATREAVAIELISLRSQALTIANSRVGSRYIFAGTDDTTMPFPPMTATGTAGAGNTGGASVFAQVIDETSASGDDYQIQFTAPNAFDVVNVTKGVTVSSGNPYVSGGDILFEGLLVRVFDDPLPPAAGDTFDIVTTLPGVYNGNSNDLKVEIEQNSFVAIGLPGDRVFKGVGLSNGVDLFEVFNDAIDALRQNDSVAIDASLDLFDKCQAQISSQQSVIGARQNLYDNSKQRLNALTLELEQQRTLLEDVDLAEAATEYNRRETAYQAALTVTARIGQVSLLDFLR